jgi:hypothetical protein
MYLDMAMKSEARPERPDARVLAAIWVGSACMLAAHVDADVSTGDAGELGGAAWTLGVAHPTGFPLDMLMLRALALLPLGSIAFRENLAVSLVGACVVTGVAWLCDVLSARLGASDPRSRALGGLLGAAALLSNPTFLGATLSVEVYATSLLCVVCAGAASSARTGPARRALWLGFGLSLGAHITAPFLLCPVLLAHELGLRGSPGRRLLNAAVLAVLGGLLLAYLPLAAQRAGPFDWGDPTNLERFVRHMTAARIREAYAGAQWNIADAPAVPLFAQWMGQPWLFAPAGLWCLVAWRRDRPVLLLLLTLLCLDLAYGAWINPMGIAERQVGHASAALLALAAGSGSARLVSWVAAYRPPWPMLVASCALASSAALLVSTSATLHTRDGQVVSERYGAQSPLVDLPARAVFVCTSDTACASALFAVYAEGSRPDLAVVPAQHLWDPTVARRLKGFRLSQATPAQLTQPRVRRSLAEVRNAELIAQRARRPVYFESMPRAANGQLALEHAPFIGLRAAGVADADVGDAQSELDPLWSVERARFGDRGPDTALARALWSSAHQMLGEALLQTRHIAPAVRQLIRAVELTPDRASAHSNLGVALEQKGDFEHALREATLAVSLAPERATSWVNLTQLSLRLHQPNVARSLLREAERRRIHDPRIVALARVLASADVAPSTQR